MKSQRDLFIALLATIGFLQETLAGPIFPTTPGLYVYDESTGTGVSVPKSGSTASFFGALGSFFSIASQGNTIINDITRPEVDLDVAAANTSIPSAKLDIYYSDGPFGPTDRSYRLITTGPHNGTVTTSAYLGTNAFDQSIPLGGAIDTFPFTVNATGIINSTNYYLTIKHTITGQISSIDSTVEIATYTVSGHVYCACDNSPVVGALVQVTNLLVTTAADGSYTIPDIAPGTYTATVTQPSYFSTNVTVTIPVATTAITSDFYLNTILSAPSFQSVISVTNGIVLSWAAIQGKTNQLQYKTNLTQSDWINLGNPFMVSNVVVTLTNPPSTDTRRFYRILQP